MLPLLRPGTGALRGMLLPRQGLTDRYSGFLFRASFQLPLRLQPVFDFVSGGLAPTDKNFVGAPLNGVFSESQRPVRFSLVLLGSWFHIRFWLMIAMGKYPLKA